MYKKSPVVKTDVHCHLQDSRFGLSAETLIDNGIKCGTTRFVCSGTSPEDWPEIDRLARLRANVIPTFGIHPWFVRNSEENRAGQYLISLVNYLNNSGYPCKRRPAVGEVGLDFSIKNVTREEQTDIFRKQLDLAKSLNRPVVIHSVRSADTVLSELQKAGSLPLILFHGIAASEKQIQQMTELGGFFSFSLRTAFSTAKGTLTALTKVPLDALLLESDGPTRLKGGEEERIIGPESLTEAVIYLARRLDIDPFRLAEIISENEERFFQRWP